MTKFKSSPPFVLVTVTLIAFGLNACDSPHATKHAPGSRVATDSAPPNQSPQTREGVPAPTGSAPGGQPSGDVASESAAGLTANDPVRITSINGKYSPVHARVLMVHPGDIVALTADVFSNETNKPSGLPVEAFAWSTDKGETCDPSREGDCLKNSPFQLTDYGVSYYVPSNMPGEVHLSVRGPRSSEAGANAEVVEDSITLRNMDEGVPAQKALITAPDLYPADTFNPSVALAGMGHWVSIDEVRYFVPTTYVATGETEWAPYRHGYWAWDNVRGPTWVSYDPWGWMTDHYGVWRRHGVYGWVWMPFEDHRYRPHTVTWFDHGDYVGWYPYYPSYPAAYRHAEALGFVDGYWLGMNIAANIGRPDWRYLPGFAIVPRAEVMAPNLITVLVSSRTLVINETVIGIVQGSFAQQRVFPFPGGPQLVGARVFLEERGSGPIPIANVATVRGLRGVEFFRIDVPNHPIPVESRFFAHLNAGPRGVPLGAMVGPSGQLILPSTNGRGFVPPPIIRNEHGQPIGTLPPTAHTRFIPQPNNPLVHEPRVLANAPHALPPGERPAFDPKAPLPGVQMENHLGPAAPALAPVAAEHGSPRGGAPSMPASGAAPATGGHPAPSGNTPRAESPRGEAPRGGQNAPAGATPPTGARPTVLNTNPTAAKPANAAPAPERTNAPPSRNVQPRTGTARAPERAAAPSADRITTQRPALAPRPGAESRRPEAPAANSARERTSEHANNGATERPASRNTERTSGRGVDHGSARDNTDARTSTNTGRVDLRGPRVGGIAESDARGNNGGGERSREHTR